MENLGFLTSHSQSAYPLKSTRTDLRVKTPIIPLHKDCLQPLNLVVWQTIYRRLKLKLPDFPCPPHRSTQHFASKGVNNLPIPLFSGRLSALGVSFLIRDSMRRFVIAWSRFVLAMCVLTSQLFNPLLLVELTSTTHMVWSNTIWKSWGTSDKGYYAPAQWKHSVLTLRRFSRPKPLYPLSSVSKLEIRHRVDRTYGIIDQQIPKWVTFRFKAILCSPLFCALSALWMIDTIELRITSYSCVV